MSKRRGQIQTPKQFETLVETSGLLVRAFRSVRMQGTSMPRIDRIRERMSKHPAFSEAANMLERENLI